MPYKHRRHAVGGAVFFSLQTAHKWINRDLLKGWWRCPHYLLHCSRKCLWKASIITVFCASLFLLWPLQLYSRSSWQAPIQPTMEQKPPWQTKVLISLIINQYAAGSTSREDFTDWMHLFSRSTARDERRDGGENKDISDFCPMGGAPKANEVKRKLI